jgi:hypothetical protein
VVAESVQWGKRRANQPDHVVESTTGHLSRRMLEKYSRIRLAVKQALDRQPVRGRAAPEK